MVSESFHSPDLNTETSQQLMFVGGGVHLAGQIDYPSHPPPSDGYPLIFIIQHACCTGRQGYAHYARMGTEAGFAVFRWDKRGTGRSGSGGHGSAIEDTLHAYQTAITQSGINPKQVFIIAQGDGTLLLGERFKQMAAIQSPMGAILAANMLDEKKIQAVDCPVHVIHGEADWNFWGKYAKAATDSHNLHFNNGSSYAVIPNADHRLRDIKTKQFHSDAETTLREWLEAQCPTSAFV